VPQRALIILTVSIAPMRLSMSPEGPEKLGSSYTTEEVRYGALFSVLGAVPTSGENRKSRLKPKNPGYLAFRSKPDFFDVSR